MSILQLIFRSFSYYWKSNLTVVIGASICTMVITGAMIVGDSIQFSLEKTANLRLGETEYVFSGIDRFFRAKLANEISYDLDIAVAPILQLDGITSAQGGKLKLNGVRVLGIDGHFASMVPGASQFEMPADNEAYISENLAQRLQLGIGDAFLLRIDKASQIPKNAPFVSDVDNQISIRLNVAKVLGSDELGRFNLNTSQTAPYNVFVNLSFLNDKMELGNKANQLLITGNSVTQESIGNTIQKHWSYEDMALGVYPVNDGKNWEIRSDRIFMDSIIVKAAKQIDQKAEPILTYMANVFKNGDNETPYSFISAGPFMKNPGVSEIVINRWMAYDLGVEVGDDIEVVYYIIGPLRRLSEESIKFKISEIVPIEGIYAEKELMPNLPGLSDAGNCREWEAGVPVELNKIRDKDEDYWKTYKGTPKAFIPYETGQKLWKNRFGECTAIRLTSNNITKEQVEERLSEYIKPIDLGFSISSVREDGLQAARGGVDFSQLFLSLSFFILVSGLILLALLLNLHLEKRVGEIGTYKALGYSRGLIRKIILLEGISIIIPGVLFGALLAIVYNKLIFLALNTVWYDIIRTSILEEVVRWNTLLTGILISLVLVSITIWFNVNKKLKKSASDLQRNLANTYPKKFNSLIIIGSWVLGLAAIGLLLYDTMQSKTLNTAVFFISGTLLLLAFLLFILYLIRKTGQHHTEDFTIKALILKNLNRNSSRSFRIIILFSLGTFVIISTGLNKKDLHSKAGDLASGTGGFLYYMETTMPVLKNLNDKGVLDDNGIESTLNFVQIRKSEGDDASCLNLNRVTAPRILGIPSKSMGGRFSFVKSTPDLNPDAPWLSLQGELEGGIVPAIMDQTVILWGLGKEVGDTLVYQDEMGQEMKLKIIGGLANSIFQGNVLIDEDLFLKHFPTSSGSNVFLVDGDFNEQEAINKEISRAFRNEGLEIEPAADRLAKFNQIENTYLTIFLMLGGLAMLLGTVGLGISLARNILDRRQEIGILRAIGFSKPKILSIITYEHLILLFAGTMAGTIAAFVATLPSILSEFVQASWQTAMIIILIILLNGFLWIYFITRSFLNKSLLETLRSE